MKVKVLVSMATLRNGQPVAINPGDLWDFPDAHAEELIARNMATREGVPTEREQRVEARGSDTPPKRKRGRPKKSQPTPETPAPVTPAPAASVLDNSPD